MSSAGPAAEMAVIERLLDRVGLHRLAPAGALIRVGDGETTYAVLETDGTAAFEERQRGVVKQTVQASSVAAALRFLNNLIAASARPSRWPVINPSEFAAGVRFEPLDRGQQLSWDDEWLLFDRRRSAESRARLFSWVVRAAPEDVPASYSELSGAPLFRVDPAEVARDFPRILAPDAPAERYSPEVRRSPGADPDDAAENDLAVALAAEIDWAPRPTGPGEVLAVADVRGTGRVIGYRQGTYAYASVAGDERFTRATFATAGAARRFLVSEMGAIGRTRRAQRTLRVPGTATGWTLDKRPTGYVVSGPGPSASFPLGPIGQQHAMIYSWCAGADLDAIAAAFRDPVGAPVFKVSGRPDGLDPTP